MDSNRSINIMPAPQHPPALQMFDFLNKLDHEHAPNNSQPALFEELSSEEEDRSLHHAASNDALPHPPRRPDAHQTLEPPRPRKPIRRGDSIVGKMQLGEKAGLSAAATALLEGELSRSASGTGALLREKVEAARRAREQKVYIREMARDEEEYLLEAGRASLPPSHHLQQGLQLTLDAIVDQIAVDIQTADMPIFHRAKKPDPDLQRKQEMLRLIKQRETELQDKIGQLSVEFQLDQPVALPGRDDFDPDGVKTRMAEQFVREKHREREEKRTRLEEERERRRALEEELRHEEEQREQQAKQQRHDKLAREFAAKQQTRKEEAEKARSEELSYRQFLKDYKQLKPLYQKKEEEFEQRQKEERKERYHALKDKQARYEPLNVELLEMHDERYQELRHEDRERKKAELELARQKEQLLQKQLDEKIYKGKFRYLVLQEMVEADAKKRQQEEERQAILARKQAYSLEVKHHFKPTIDPNKRRQIEQILNAQQQHSPRKHRTPNRVAYSDHYSTISSQAHPLSEPEADPRKEGQKYHRLFKQYIRAKIERGEVKSEDEPEEKAPARHPDYLKELREKFEGRIPSRSTRLERQIDKLKEGSDYRALMLKAEEFEGRARQREVKLRNVAHAPGEEAQLEEEYLCAIKAKMQLINHMD